MKKQPEPARQAWSKNQELLVQIAQNFKMLEEENQMYRKQLQKSNGISQSDRQRILKLYSYRTWEEFMEWINSKFRESGQDFNQNQDDSIRQVLSEIMEQPDLEESDLATQKETATHQQSQVQAEILAMENARLRRQNIKLKSKIHEMHEYRKYMQKNYK